MTENNKGCGKLAIIAGVIWCGIYLIISITLSLILPTIGATAQNAGAQLPWIVNLVYGGGAVIIFIYVFFFMAAATVVLAGGCFTTLAAISFFKNREVPTETE